MQEQTTYQTGLYDTESVVVLCRARNAVGIQKVPCRIHLSQTEIPPVSLLTSVSAESAKSFLNCSSRAVSSLAPETVSVSCSMAKEIEKLFEKFVLQGFKNNNTLAWNSSRLVIVDFQWNFSKILLWELGEGG